MIVAREPSVSKMKIRLLQNLLFYTTLLAQSTLETVALSGVSVVAP